MRALTVYWKGRHQLVVVRKLHADRTERIRRNGFFVATLSALIDKWFFGFEYHHITGDHRPRKVHWGLCSAYCESQHIAYSSATKQFFTGHKRCRIRSDQFVELQIDAKLRRIVPELADKFIRDWRKFLPMLADQAKFEIALSDTLKCVDHGKNWIIIVPQIWGLSRNKRPTQKTIALAT